MKEFIFSLLYIYILQLTLLIPFEISIHLGLVKTNNISNRKYEEYKKRKGFCYIPVIGAITVVWIYTRITSYLIITLGSLVKILKDKGKNIALSKTKNKTPQKLLFILKKMYPYSSLAYNTNEYLTMQQIHSNIDYNKIYCLVDLYISYEGKNKEVEKTFNEAIDIIYKALKSTKENVKLTSEIKSKIDNIVEIYTSKIKNIISKEKQKEKIIEKKEMVKNQEALSNKLEKTISKLK